MTGRRIHKKTISIILGIAFALAAVAVCAGCGDEQSNSKSNGNGQDPAGAEAPAEYVGVLKEVYGGAFKLAVEPGASDVAEGQAEQSESAEPDEWEFQTDENTTFEFGARRHMYVGDRIRVTCHSEVVETGTAKDETDAAQDEDETDASQSDADAAQDGALVAEKVTILEKGDAVTNLGDFAASLCWPYGEISSGRYDTGEKTEAYAALYDRIKPQDQSTFSTGTQWRAGASCDLLVATAVQGFGLTGFPVALAEQCDYFFINEQYQDDFEKIETGGDPARMQHGDICIYISAGSENNGQGHIFVVNKTNGMNLRSNGHYRKDKGYYGVTDEMKDHYDPGHYKYFGVFRIK